MFCTILKNNLVQSDLLERIREIRTSERRYYQKITDIYAECSADYDPKSAIRFCDIQNVSLLNITSIRASPCAVLYSKMLELNEFCINSFVEIVRVK